MKTIGCVIAIFLSGLVAADAARAASITSEDFVAIVGPTTEFLAASDKLALANSESGRVRAFARREATVEERTHGALADWRAAQDRAAAAAADAPSLDRLGPVFGALAIPLDAIAETSHIPGTPFAQLPSATRLTEAGNAALTRLAAISGAGFDAAYRAAQLDAFLRLRATYKDFVLNGDDETLRSIAVATLPKVERLIASLRGV